MITPKKLVSIDIIRRNLDSDKKARCHRKKRDIDIFLLIFFSLSREESLQKIFRLFFQNAARNQRVGIPFEVLKGQHFGNDGAAIGVVCPKYEP